MAYKDIYYSLHLDTKAAEEDVKNFKTGYGKISNINLQLSRNLMGKEQAIAELAAFKNSSRFKQLSEIDLKIKSGTRLSGDEFKLLKEYQALDKQINKIQGSMNNVQAGAGGFFNTIKMGWLAMTGAIAGFVSYINQAIDKGAEALRNQYVFLSVIHNVGLAYKDVAKDIEELSSKNAIMDDEIQQMYSYGISQGIANDKLKQFVQTSLDYMATGKSRERAMMQTAVLAKKGGEEFDKFTRSIEGAREGLVSADHGLTLMNKNFDEMNEKIGKLSLRILDPFIKLQNFLTGNLNKLLEKLFPEESIEDQMKKLEDKINDHKLKLQKATIKEDWVGQKQFYAEILKNDTLKLTALKNQNKIKGEIHDKDKKITAEEVAQAGATARTIELQELAKVTKEQIIALSKQQNKFLNEGIDFLSQSLSEMISWVDISDELKTKLSSILSDISQIGKGLITGDIFSIILGGLKLIGDAIFKTNQGSTEEIQKQETLFEQMGKQVENYKTNIEIIKKAHEAISKLISQDAQALQWENEQEQQDLIKETNNTINKMKDQLMASREITGDDWMHRMARSYLTDPDVKKYIDEMAAKRPNSDAAKVKQIVLDYQTAQTELVKYKGIIDNLNDGEITQADLRALKEAAINELDEDQKKLLYDLLSQYSDLLDLTTAGTTTAEDTKAALTAQTDEIKKQYDLLIKMQGIDLENLDTIRTMGIINQASGMTAAESQDYMIGAGVTNQFLSMAGGGGNKANIGNINVNIQGSFLDATAKTAWNIINKRWS